MFCPGAGLRLRRHIWVMFNKSEHKVCPSGVLEYNCGYLTPLYTLKGLCFFIGYGFYCSGEGTVFVRLCVSRSLGPQSQSEPCIAALPNHFPANIPSHLPPDPNCHSLCVLGCNPHRWAIIIWTRMNTNLVQLKITPTLVIATSFMDSTPSWLLWAREQPDLISLSINDGAEMTFEEREWVGLVTFFVSLGITWRACTIIYINIEYM